MKQIRTIIIDDHQADIDVLLLLTKKVPRLLVCGTYTNPMKGLEAAIREKVDLVFLDVQMEPLNGLELMQQLDPKIQVVLCTSYNRFALDAFRLEAAFFLTKPIRYDEFLQAVERVEILLNFIPSVISRTPDHHYFFVKANGENYRQKIEFRDINYFEAANNRVLIHLAGQEYVEVVSSLTKINEQLPQLLFIRIHYSYIVPKARVRTVHLEHVVLKKPNNHILSVGPKFKKDLAHWVNDRLLK